MNWVQLFEDNNIEYVTRGPNTKHGEVSIRCPFCAEEDPSQHLGINLNTNAWGCLRNARHRGMSTPWLIAALLGCSNHQAKLVLRQYDVGDPEALPDPATLFEPTGEALNGAEPRSSGPLTLPGDFKTIENRRLVKPYWDYLVRRGFEHPGSMIKHFGLKCALLGRWKGRLIIPLWGGHHRNNLLGWTARAIGKTVNAPRYLSSGEEIKQTVFNYPNLKRTGGRLLTVVEGPMDALKLDYFGKQYGCRATCLFGANMTEAQADCINRLCYEFDHVAVMLDPDAVEQGFDVRNWLIHRNVSMQQVPEGAEDPGAMSGRQVHDYISSMQRYWIKEPS